MAEVMGSKESASCRGCLAASKLIADTDGDGKTPTPLFRRLSPPGEAIKTLCELFSKELDYRKAHGLDVHSLRQYYRNLFLGESALSSLGIHGYISRLAPAVVWLQQAHSTVRLLDAGCGYGTESLLFALLGVDVTGVELVPERVALAQSRLSFYQGLASAPLSIEFVNADVMAYLRYAGPFDAIWIMEALSHIHPQEVFLPLAYECLSPSGLLIATDPNALNPIALYRAWRIRGTPGRKLRVKALDPNSGTPVYEAVERILSVTDYMHRLSKAGFQVREVITSGFMASSSLPGSLHRNRLVVDGLASLQKCLQSLPMVRWLGANYTVVAQKAG